MEKIRMKNKKMRHVCAAVLVFSLAVATGGCATAQDSKETVTQETAEKEATDTPTASGSVVASDVSGDNYLHISWKGKEYTYNSRIITVMYAGVDSDDELTTYNRYSIAPRADAIELVIFDDYHKKISVLSISRDTITSVARYTMNGHYRDRYDTHLGYAYTYGDGGKASCDNMKDAVSTLLKGIPIHEYIITNNSSVDELNDMVGGLTVTVPNDDLLNRYPEMKKGAEVTLTGETADDFARWRDVSILYSNNGRMERQKEFSSRFLEKFVAMAKADIEGTWQKITDYSACYQTSITKSQYLDLTERFKTESFSEDQYYILAGEDGHDDVNDVDIFTVDEDSLMDTLVSLFYLEEE